MVYNHKEYQKEYQKLYKENNKEKTKEYNRLCKENNKEYYKEKSKEYYKTKKGIKSRIIKGWKTKGVINDDFDKLYDYYLNCKFCEECNIDFTLCKKNLDHDHTTGLFRNVVCSSCNIKRGFRDRGHILLTQSEKKFNYRLKKFILS